MITVRVSTPRKRKRKYPVFVCQNSSDDVTINDSRSDELETSHRRNKMQDNRITKIRHMRVVKAIR
jgi:hypothetical protein